MKKKIILTIMLVLVLLTSIAIALFSTNPNDKLPFADTGWTREDSDTEYLSFGSDGSFSYWCSCGNPVDNADICETYTYNAKKKTITLKCYGPDEKIKVVKYNAKELVLKFDNETRKFTNTKYSNNEEEE